MIESADTIWGLGEAPTDSPLRSAEEVRSYLQCQRVTAELLFRRGYRSVQKLERLLRIEPSALPDAMSLKDMDRAVTRIASALRERALTEKIVIYGDYDVDGTCGSALLFELLTELGASVTVYQPNRFKEGYGVHVQAIEQLIDQGATLIITVDCGITAHEPAAKALERGVDLLVLDHHKLSEKGLPQAFAVVNPQRDDDTSGLRNLCGTGIAFFFAIALRATLRAQGHFAEKSKPEPNLMRFLDLVAVATVADVMDVRGVNRILIGLGLKLMATRPRAGIKAILEAAQIRTPTSTHCGFILGPRINAAGRLGSAKSALDLLTTQDPARAQEYARELEWINAERRKTQAEVHVEAELQAQLQINNPMFAEMRQTISAAEFGPWPRALVLASPEGALSPWHEGVVGIVASKLVEQFKRPVFVLTEKEASPGVIKGSIRSVPGVDIIAAVSAPQVCSHLLNFGGHAYAGGVTLRRENLDQFIRALNEHLALTTSAQDYTVERRVDLEFEVDVFASEFNEALLTEITALEPFGRGFEEPIFRVKNCEAKTLKILKEKHLKFSLARGPKADVMWFNAAENVESIDQGRAIHLDLSAQWNVWAGVKRMQFQVRHGEFA